MKTKPSKRQSPAPPVEVLHLVATWQVKPGAILKALCGAEVECPPDIVPGRVESPKDGRCNVVCALCEVAYEFGDVPPEPGTYSQEELF